MDQKPEREPALETRPLDGIGRRGRSQRVLRTSLTEAFLWVAAGISLVVGLLFAVHWMQVDPSPAMQSDATYPEDASDASTAGTTRGTDTKRPARPAAGPRSRAAIRQTAAPGWGRVASEGQAVSPPSWKGTKTPTPTGKRSTPFPTGDERQDPLHPRLSIAGRVLDQDGYPIAGEAVIARAESVFDPEADLAGEHWTTTAPNGYYSIRPVGDGQYRVSAGESGYAKAELVVRAGVKNADLVLEREQTFQVYGVVTDTAGQGMRGVQVIPNLSPAIPKLTDRKGQYALSVGLRQRTQTLQLRFEREGYEPQAFHLEDSEWEGTGGVELDVALVPLTSTTEVGGTLESAAGEPVEGETVVLYSPSLRQRYEAASDPRGEFSLPEVAVAEDYLVVVRPSGPYQDYTQSNLRVSNDPVDLRILLNPQESGKFLGQLTDAQGNPIPHFTFMLRGENAAGRIVRVTGDRQGRYLVAGVPYGGLIFETHSFPYFRITNVQLVPDSDAPLPLVVDWGDHEIRGRVVDSSGAPLAVPNVYIGWSYEGRGIRSTAVRTGAADAEGEFRFANLGPGRHTISVSAPGFQSAQLEYDVGSAANRVTVQLEEAEDNAVLN